MAEKMKLNYIKIVKSKRLKICQKCYGSGKIRSDLKGELVEIKTCKNCNGMGRIRL